MNLLNLLFKNKIFKIKELNKKIKINHKQMMMIIKINQKNNFQKKTVIKMKFSKKKIKMKFLKIIKNQKKIITYKMRIKIFS